MDLALLVQLLYSNIRCYLKKINSLQYNYHQVEGEQHRKLVYRDD
ncbi:hypothetical protein [Nostoc sp. JL31]